MIDDNEVSDCQYGLAVQGKGQIYLKSVLGLVRQTFMEGVDIRHNDCLQSVSPLHTQTKNMKFTLRPVKFF